MLENRRAEGNDGWGGWRFTIGEYLVTPGGEKLYILLKGDISYAVVDLCGYLIGRNRFGSH
jgi:hypothetical protein